jgi:hypothetical protein
LFEITMSRLPVVPTRWFPNATEVGATEISGPPPMPETGIDVAPAGSFDWIEMVPLTGPVVVGERVAEIVVDDPAARVIGSAAEETTNGALVVIEWIASGAAPVFEIVKLLDGLVVPTGTAPNECAAGTEVASGSLLHTIRMRSHEMSKKLIWT